MADDVAQAQRAVKGLLKSTIHCLYEPGSHKSLQMVVNVKQNILAFKIINRPMVTMYEFMNVGLNAKKKHFLCLSCHGNPFNCH